jgi:Tfp pilus assembly protein PilV
MIDTLFGQKLNEKGFGLLEVVIAVFMTAVGILPIFSLLSPAWRTVGRSDSLGRASGILYEQLMRIQNHESLLQNRGRDIAHNGVHEWASLGSTG